MKKYAGLILGATLAFCGMATYATTTTTTTTPLNLGVEYHIKSTEAPIQSWIPIAKAIANVMHQQVMIFEYQDHQPIVKYLSSGKITFGYIKKQLDDSTLAQNNDIKLLAVAVTKSSMTGKVGTAYNSELIVAKNSPIHTLSDLQNKTMAYYSMNSASNYTTIKKQLAAQHIQVTWKKFPTVKAAFSAVANHQADAISAWTYLVNINANKNNLKSIQTTSGFRNPGIYVNTRFVSQTDRQQLRAALAHVKGPYNIVGFQ